MVRKHFTFQLWRNKSKWIIKEAQLKCSSLEHPTLKSVYFEKCLFHNPTTEVVKFIIFLQFTWVSFSIIKVRKTGSECIGSQNTPRTAQGFQHLHGFVSLIPVAGTYGIGRRWARFEYHRFKLKRQENGAGKNKNTKTKHILWLKNQWSQWEKDIQN